MESYSEDIVDIYKTAIDCPKAPMVLRVGVAGKRDLSGCSDTLLSQNRTEIKNVYAVLEQALQKFATEERYKEVNDFYLNNGQHRIRFISSLAEGMDRICVEEQLLPKGSELAAITPFLLEDFRKDFEAGASVIDRDKGTEREFDRILERLGYGTNKASLIELDGNRNNKEEAYLHCSEVLADRTDILIAVYPFNSPTPDRTDLGATVKDERDHEANLGCPGTEATIAHAKKNRIPVIEINLHNPSEIRLCYTDARKGDVCDLNLSIDELRTIIEEKLEEILLFADSFNSDAFRLSERGRGGDGINQKVFRDAVTNCHKMVAKGFSAYESNNRHLIYTNTKPDFNLVGPIELLKPSPKLWPNLFSKFIKWMAYTKKTSDQHQSDDKAKDSQEIDVTASITGEASHLLYGAFLRADRLANYYSAIHRTSFLLLYLLGAFAIACAGLALMLHDSYYTVKTLVVIELLTLGAIGTIYYCDHTKYLYHKRWLEYRCLAEFLRPLVFISTIGRSFPVLSFHFGDEFHHRTKVGHEGPGNNWVAIYMATLIRYVGFDHCRLDSANKRIFVQLILKNWLMHQKNYHNKNAERMELITERLETFGTNCFKITLLILSFKLVVGMFWSNMPHILSVIASYMGIVLPVMAATSLAIANHGEFGISKQRSRSMAALLARKIDLLETNGEQLSSQELVNHVDRITQATMKEVSDWLEIYEVKKTELG